jgi:probable phosphoglycerate mutase
LVVEQLNGNWKIKNERLKEINTSIKSILHNFENISFNFIYRNLNTHADSLANQGINNHGI